MEKHSFTRWSLVVAGILLGGTLFWYLMVVRLFPIIPDDFSYSANILSYDNFFDERKNDFTGEILSKTKYSYRVDKKEDNILTIRNIFDVRKPSGEPIFKVERLYGIDQLTGKHIHGYGDKNRDGYLFAPKNTGKEFTYWHINYDMPAQMKFVGQEVIEGLPVQRYECNYHADQTENLSFLPGVPETRGVELDISLQLWIEPATGFLVKYEDHTTAWYYDMHTKERLHPWNRFHNAFEETSISKQVQVAQLARETNLWQNRYLPLSNFLIILIVLSLGYPEQKKLWRPYIATILILVMGLSTSVLLYFSLKKTNEVRIETIFTRDCESIRASIQYELERSVDVLTSIKTNYVSLGKITREQYRTIAKLSLKNNDNIIAMGWVPIVPIAKRDSFEMKARYDGFSDFQFKELKNGSIAAAGERPEYFPIYYTEPYENDKNIMGYDLASDFSPKAALEKAASTGEATATSSLQFVGNEKENNKVFFILIPVYENELGLRPTHTVHTFLSAAIGIQSLIQGAVTHMNVSNKIAFAVIDPEMENKEVLFTNVDEKKIYTLSKKSTLQVANRPWILEFQSVPIFTSSESFMFTLLPPLLVALITFALGAFIFHILSDNQLLRFAHIISHDLRSPVGNLRSLLNFYNESDSKEDKEMLLSKFTTVITHLTTTLNELMDVWKIQKDVRHEREQLSFEEVFTKTRESLSGYLIDTKARVSWDFSKAPHLKYPKAYLESIMLNLFSNAIKYRSPDRIPQIHFETSTHGTEISLTVRDNGLGIDLQKHNAKLFGLNNTFHEHPDSRGVGLYITRTQIQEMGGSISVESEVGKGSTFTVVFNKGNGK